MHIKSNIILSFHDISLNFLEFQYETLIYYAHSAQDKLGNLLPYDYWQTLQSHSVNVGEIAAEFAWVFGGQEIACQTGKLHDLGKYSEVFNQRLHGGSSVDHAIAGAKIAKMLAL